MKFFFSLCVFFLSVTATVYAEIPEIMAKVGGVPVTRYEVSREFQKSLPTAGSYHGGVPEARRLEIWESAFESMVERAYKVRYALDEELAVSKKPVDQKIDELIQKTGGKKKLKEALGGESIDDFRASLYRELLAKEAEKRAVDSKVKISEDRYREYFAKNASHFPRPKMYKASHILIKVHPSLSTEEKSAKKQKAEELARKAKAGEDFYNLAYYNSDDRSKYVGGDLGYFQEGATASEFDQAVAAMKPGDVAGPVQTLYGYHIIKLVDVQPARLYTYEEARPLIESTLLAQDRNETKSAWMKELKSKYQFESFVLGKE